MNIYYSTYNDGKAILVFGSNLAGLHNTGIAAEAKDNWGACNGRGVRRTGQAYAIPTKGWQIETLPLSAIEHYVQEFIQYACAHPELTFLVTRIGCGLEGYTDADIAPMFRTAPENCQLPEGWRS